ncbi:MAG: hypothetical protein ACOC36_00905 [Fibrobacterota bacterium]
MRKSIGLLIVIFVIVSLVRILASGVQARDDGTMTAFLVMLPATLSMLLSLVFTADRIHFRWLDWSMIPVALVSSLLFLTSIALLLFGNSLIPQVNTLTLIPSLLVFIIFPLFIPIADRYKREKPKRKIPEKTRPDDKK